MNSRLLSTVRRTGLASAAAGLALALGVSTGLADQGAALVAGSQEDFEGGGLGFTLTGGFDTGSATTDYWAVIPNDGSKVNSAAITTGGIFGSASPAGGSVLAGDDTNAGGTDPVSVTFNQVNVAGLTNLSVNLLLAAQNPTQGLATAGFDAGGLDEVEIQVSYNSGAFQQLAIYQPDSSFNGGTNSYLSQNGGPVSGTDPTAIEQGFKNFSHALTPATTAQIRILVSADGSNEYVAIDNFRICGDPAVTNPPVLADIEGTAVNYAEGDPATQVTNTITVSDGDSTDLTGATVQITSNNTPSEDVLAGTSGGGVTFGSYDSGTGTLTMSGTASLAAYQAALRTVTYENTNATNPNTAQRTVSFQVTDDQSNNSNLAMRNINVANTIQAFSIPHTETFDDGLGTGDRYEVVGGFDVGTNDFFRQLPASDATARFAIPIVGVVGTGFFGGEDIDQNGEVDGGKVVLCLDAVGIGNLSVDVLLAAAASNPFELTDGVWVEYQFDGGAWNELIAFRPVSGGGALAEDTDDNGVGDGTALTATLTNYNLPILASGGVLKVRVRALNSTTAEEIAFDELTVNGSAVGASPVLASIDPGPLGYTEGDGAVVISSTATITDTDDTDMEGATVEISDNYVNGEDVLSFTPSGGITGSFVAGTGILTLSGTASLAAYETALQSVTYENTNLAAPNQNTRTVTYLVNDGDSNSNAQTSLIEVLDLVPAEPGPHCESFETDGLGTRYAANSFNIPPDFFERAAANFGGLTGTNADGTFAFVGKDTGADGNAVHAVEIIVDTSGGTSLMLDLKLAALANQFETTDEILIERESDGGGFVQLTSFNGTGVNTSLTNGMITLGPDYTDLNFSLPDASETRIRVTMNSSATAEEFAVDNICVTGNFGTEIDVQGLATSIPGDGTNVPSTTDDTDFGSVECATGSGTHTFTILNDGSADLNLTGAPDLVTITGSAAFTVSAQPALNPIAPAGSTTFQISFDPATTGPHTAVVSIDNDDLDEDPYQFNIAGLGVDTTAPVITLTGGALTLECGIDTFSDPGSSALDACDGVVPVTVGGDTVLVGTPGIYVITYDAADSVPNAATQVTRTVTVQDTTAPVITLTGGALTLECNIDTFSEPGFSASDACEGDLSGSVGVGGDTVDVSTPGTYVITYNVSDSVPNAATQVTRTVTVQDTTAPVITLTGGALTLECNIDTFSEPGFSASDACEGDLSGSVTVGGDTVDVSTPGIYVITYDVSDSVPNAATQVTRTVTVQDTTAPVITLTGGALLTLECNVDTFVEPGFSASDACEGDLTGSVVVGGDTVDVSTPGTYVITYDVSDSVPNAATQVTRTVTVQDTIAPRILGAKDIVITIPNGDTQTQPGEVTYNPTAVDICDPTPTIVCSPVSGSQFGLGTNVVTCTATDSSANVTVETFDVIVLEADLTPATRSLDSSILRGAPATGAGLPVGATIFTINDAFLQNGGNIIYSATLKDAGINTSGVFLGPTAGPQPAIAARNTNPSGAGNYGLFSRLALNDASNASFQSLLGTGPAHFLDPNINTAARNQPAAPVVGTPDYSTLYRPALASNGDLLSAGALRIGTGTPAVVFSDDTLITNTGVSVLAREGSLTSLPSGTVNYGQIHPRVVASEGGDYTAFAAHLADTAGFDASNNTAVFTQILGVGSPAAIVREGDTANGTGGGVFNAFLGESINSSGALAIRGTARGAGITSANNGGLWTNAPNLSAPPILIAREGAAAPCPPTGQVGFDRFSRFFMNDDGSVCFEAFLKNISGGSSVNSANDRSIWSWDITSGLHLIVREEDLGNNTGDAVIQTISDWACSGLGALTYEVTFKNMIGDTDGGNNRAVYRQLPADPAPLLVVRRGDEFDLGGTTRTVAGVSIDGESNPGGGTGGYGRAINDAGDVLLRLVLDANQSGIFTLAP